VGFKIWGSIDTSTFNPLAVCAWSMYSGGKELALVTDHVVRSAVLTLEAAPTEEEDVGPELRKRKRSAKNSATDCNVDTVMFSAPMKKQRGYLRIHQRSYLAQNK